MKRLLLLFLATTALACQDRQGADASQAKVQSVKAPVDPDFKLDDYWYQGEAEISRYTLEQNRYDAVHPGEVILIFVTEDFRTDKQVKDEGQSEGPSVSVLKNIRHRAFSTGLYDYHLMTTAFTPVEGPVRRTLKVSASTLDWCGQTYMQLNLDRKTYGVQQFSYFEREGDRDFEVPAAVLEDELWNRIRIAPESLPTGDFELIPAAAIARLKHLPFRAVQAQGELQPYRDDAFQGDQLRAYTLQMPALKRELQIVFSGRKPYRIEGWTDRYPSAFDGVVRTTVARRTHTLKNAYWEKNDPADRRLRGELGR